MKYINLNIFKNSNIRIILVLLLLTDFVFILLHIFYSFSIIEGDSRLSIKKDLGYAEIFQYIKEFWVFVLLLLLFINRRKLVYFSWSLLYLYLLIDDSLRIHENLGKFLVKYFDIQPFLKIRAKDFGELGVSLFFGSILFTFLIITHLKSDSIAKKASKLLFKLTLMLVFFGVFIDTIHIVVPHSQWIFGLIEDGGEMISVSLILWYSFDQYQELKE